MTEEQRKLMLHDFRSRVKEMSLDQLAQTSEQLRRTSDDLQEESEVVAEHFTTLRLLRMTINSPLTSRPTDGST